MPSGLKKPNKWILFIFLFIIFGGVIEMIQPYVNHYGEWLDFFANTIGVISGFFVGVILNNKFLTSYGRVVLLQLSRTKWRILSKLFFYS